MPRNFPDIPSGSDLPTRLMPVAMRLWKDLCRSRDEGRCSPTKGVTNAYMRQKYGAIIDCKKGKRTLTSPEMRAIINYLRANGKPIGSCGNEGYFPCYTHQEWKQTSLSLQDRENAIRRARIGGDKAFEKLNQEALFEEGRTE